MNTTVDTARRAVGPLGALLPVTFTDMPSVDRQREAVGRLERAGYRTAWTNEVIGKDALVQLAVLLGATERMVFGTSIANIWAREPQTMHAAAAQLVETYPDRFVLGLGVGYPQQAARTGRDFGKPLTTMRGPARSLTVRCPLGCPRNSPRTRGKYSARTSYWSSGCP